MKIFMTYTSNNNCNKFRVNKYSQARQLGLLIKIALKCNVRMVLQHYCDCKIGNVNNKLKLQFKSDLYHKSY